MANALLGFRWHDIEPKQFARFGPVERHGCIVTLACGEVGRLTTIHDYGLYIGSEVVQLEHPAKRDGVIFISRATDATDRSQLLISFCLSEEQI